MKRKILSCVAVLMVIVFAMKTGMSNSFSQEHSESLLENIEALADYEWNQNGRYCWSNSEDDYSSSALFTYIRCIDCYTTTATSVWNQGQCWHR